MITQPQEDLPEALRPIYETASVNDSVELFSGRMEVMQGAQQVAGIGRVRFEWWPSPRVGFSFPAGPPIPSIKIDAGTLRLDGWAPGAAAHVSKMMMNRSGDTVSQIVFGQVQGAYEHEQGQSLGHLLFHLPNFPGLLGSGITRSGSGQSWAGRIILAAEPWRVTVDRVETGSEIAKLLGEQSGFALTHVGRLERSDGATFNATQAHELLESLWWFFSFARGQWTGPLLPVGFDADGNRVWEEWHAKKVMPCRYVLSWLDPHQPHGLADLFPNFFRRWQDPDWNEVVRLAIHWYVEANAQAGAIEGAMVFTQTAFELLSAAIIEEEGRINPKKFDSWDAVDRIRWLLKWVGLPTAIPPHFTSLAALAVQKKWPDAPQALTAMRNPLTHPSPKNRERFQDYPVAARNEAWNLGLWYLELAILRLLDYHGVYGNRLKLRYAGEVEAVPWAVPAPGTASAPAPPTAEPAVPIPVFPDMADDTETDAEVLQRLREMG